MRRWLAGLAVALALFLVVGRAASAVLAEWQWHAAMGSLAVYRSELAHEIAWRALAIAAGFAFVGANLYALRRSIVALVLPRRLGNIEIGEAVSARRLLGYVVAVSFAIALLLSAPPGDWTTLALSRIAQSFREIDPFTDRDLAFAVAWLPFESDLYEWAGRLMVVTAGMIVVLYALTPSLRFRRGAFYISTYCRRHLAVLAALALLLLTWRWRLDAVSLTSAPPGGGPYDAYWHAVGGPMLTWTAGLAAVAAFVVLWGGWHGYGRVAALAGLLAAVGGPLASAVMPYLTERRATASELREENRPYATTRELFTRRAFGADAIDSMPADADFAKSAPDAIAGVPLWDPAAMAYAVAGDARTADSARIAWESAEGAIRVAVLLQRPGETRWSVSLLDAAAADEQGRPLPALPSEVLDLPPPGWPQLLVYPGAEEPLVVPDTVGRLLAPSFETWWERIALAWNVRTPRLLAASRPGEVRPRLVFHRDVRDRLRAMAPFLTVGPTIAPLIRGDSLYWVAELFTTSDTYPLSDRLFFAGRERAYVHHAATAYVQAMTGAVTLVAVPAPDAIMRTWMRRFPSLFTRPGSFAAAIERQHPPVVDWARIQATTLARVRSDAGSTSARSVAATDNADADLATQPPTLVGLRGAAGLAWSLPVIDGGGVVLGAVIATGGAIAHTYWAPSARPEDRWPDILDRLQRAADSAGIGRRRAGARRGRVVAIPTATGIWYAQSHYEWSVDGAPTFVGVAAYAAGRARAGATLGEALGVHLGDRAGRASSFRAAVDDLYRRMDDALRRGDWPAFGAAFSALGRLVRLARLP